MDTNYLWSYFQKRSASTAPLEIRGTHQGSVPLKNQTVLIHFNCY